jgi:hypothetical protein
MKALHKMLQVGRAGGTPAPPVGSGRAGSRAPLAAEAHGSSWCRSCGLRRRARSHCSIPASADPLVAAPPPVQARNVTYQHSHGKPMSCPATAQLLSNTLYNRRFFPLFTFNLCAGLDEEGERPAGALSERPSLSPLLPPGWLERPVERWHLGTATTGHARTPARSLPHSCFERRAHACLGAAPPLPPPPCPRPAPGKGAVYTYDAIGSYERTGYSCQGSGKDLMQPVLDNQLKAASPLLLPPRVRPPANARAAPLGAAAYAAPGPRSIALACLAGSGPSPGPSPSSGPIQRAAAG